MAICYLVCFQVQLTDINCIEAVISNYLLPHSCIFWANYFPKCLNLCTFLWRLLYILLDSTQSEMYILTTFHKRAERTKMLKGKKTSELNCFHRWGEPHLLNWPVILFICLLFALLTYRPISFAYVKWLVSSRYGGRLCRDTRSQTHTQECDRRYKIIINLSGKYGRPLCRNACGEDCRTFPHSTNVSPVISY